MVKVAGKTDVGNKRKSNEDSYFVDEANNLYIVADGMGGHKAGATASKLAIEEITQVLSRGEADDEDKTPVELDPDSVASVRRSLTLAITSANHRIYELSHENSEFRGMGTTVVACRLIEDSLVVAHVGDSRLYVLRDGQLRQMTKDHSRVQELIDSDRITEEEAKKYPLRNVITRAIGGDSDILIDVNDYPFNSTDAWLLCSDGLSSVLSMDMIRDVILSFAGDPAKACDSLIELTKLAGAPDNVTVILIEGQDFSRTEDSQAPMSQFSLYENSQPEPMSAEKKGLFSSLFRKMGFPQK